MLCPIGQSNEKPPLQALAKWWEHVTLVSNAVKYSNEGGMIQIRVKQEKLKAVLIVEDQGTVTVISKVGCGSRFTVTLPAGERTH